MVSFELSLDSTSSSCLKHQQNDAPDINWDIRYYTDIDSKNYYFLILFILFSGDGVQIRGKAVVITTGTFLKAHINIGMESRAAGRMGDAPAIGLANTLEGLGFRMSRLKTGKLVFLC